MEPGPPHLRGNEDRVPTNRATSTEKQPPHFSKRHPICLFQRKLLGKVSTHHKLHRQLFPWGLNSLTSSLCMLGEGFQQCPSTVLSTGCICDITTLILSEWQQCNTAIYGSLWHQLAFSMRHSHSSWIDFVLASSLREEPHCPCAELSQSKEGSVNMTFMVTESWS